MYLFACTVPASLQTLIYSVVLLQSCSIGFLRNSPPPKYYIDAPGLNLSITVFYLPRFLILGENDSLACNFRLLRMTQKSYGVYILRIWKWH